MWKSNVIAWKCHRVALGPIFLGLTFVAYAQDIQLPNKKDSVKFAVIGDNGTGTKPEYEIGKRLAASREKFPFEFVVMMPGIIISFLFSEQSRLILRTTPG